MVMVRNTIDAVVTDVRVFGVFCEYECVPMLVRIVDLSWIASFNSTQQFAQPGDKLRVKILYVDSKTGSVIVSLKDRHPNPWETDQLKIGTEHSATVVRYVERADRCGNQPAYLLELLPGAYVMLRVVEELSWKPGNRINVAITSSNFESRSVSVKLSSQHPN